ncbi:MAG: hypothetical protein ACKVX9_13425, partial [Blastocatellia bacterium]
ASKRFCTVCGTNLHAVNQPLPARWPLAHAPSPADPKGLWELPGAFRLALAGGVLVAYKFFSFALSGNSPFGVLTVLGLILLAVGISKLASEPAPNPVRSRMPEERPRPIHAAESPSMAAALELSPQSASSSAGTIETPSRNTNELEPIQQPLSSVTEEETRQLNR